MPYRAYKASNKRIMVNDDVDYANDNDDDDCVAIKGPVAWARYPYNTKGCKLLWRSLILSYLWGALVGFIYIPRISYVCRFLAVFALYVYVESCTTLFLNKSTEETSFSLKERYGVWCLLRLFYTNGRVK